MITVEVSGNSVRIRVSRPHVDLDAGREFREILTQAREHASKEVTVDLGGVMYVNSAFIGALLAFDGSLRKEGGSLKIVHVGQEVMDIFRMLRLEEHFDVTGTQQS